MNAPSTLLGVALALTLVGCPSKKAADPSIETPPGVGSQGETDRPLASTDSPAPISTPHPTGGAVTAPTFKLPRTDPAGTAEAEAWDALSAHVGRWTTLLPGMLKDDAARATLEATAFQTREVLDAMEKDSGVTLTALKVDGGMVFNEMLMQFQADMLDVPVIRPKVAETTALGAAYAAGLAVGFWDNLDELRANWGRDKKWQPQMDADKCEKLYKGWKKAVTRTFDWVE